KLICDLLIITPDTVTIDEEKKAEVQEMVAHFGQVNMSVHPISFFLQQLNKGNIFFSWVHKNGLLLYDHNNSSQLLPPVRNSEYWPQVEAFYANDPEMATYLDAYLQPVVKPAPPAVKEAVHRPLEIHLRLNAQPGWEATVPTAAAATNAS